LIFYTISLEISKGVTKIVDFFHIYLTISSFSKYPMFGSNHSKEPLTVLKARIASGSFGAPFNFFIEMTF
jgi:hypothetical protein